MNEENINKYPKGSEWRRWDLHIHTKYTQKGDNFTSENFDAFCETMFRKAISNKISVIGITDYFSIENFNRTKKFVQKIDSNNNFSIGEKLQIKQIFLIPNIELRILPATNSGSLINIHCLINPKEDILNELENNFFGSLEDSGGYKMNKRGIISLGKNGDDNLDEVHAYKKGIDKFHLEPSKLISLFKDKHILRENILIAVSNSSNDGVSAVQKHYKLFENDTGSLDEVRRNIYVLSDIIFSSNSKDRDFFLGKKNGFDCLTIIKKCGSLKPCIHGSDAHDEEKLFKPDDSRYCWVKADPSFEGLKQIICEPAERVAIQEIKPEEKNGYQVIDSIKIDGEICNQTIELNANLNTIIGGRSTGKSTLLKLLAFKINPKIAIEDEFIKNAVLKTIVKWQDGEEDKPRDIEYFPQNHMYKIASNEGDKNRLIEGIVRGKDSSHLLQTYDSFCGINKMSIQTNIDNLFKLQLEQDGLIRQLKEKGDKKGVEKEIENIRIKISESSKGNTFSEHDFKLFEKLKQNIANAEQMFEKIAKNKVEIEQLKEASLFDQSFIYKLNNLPELREVFRQIQLQTQTDWKDALSKALSDLELSAVENNKKIELLRKDVLYDRGQEYLKKNTQYNELSERLLIEKKNLDEIDHIQSNIDKIEQQKIALLNKTIENHVEYSKKLDKLIADFSLVHDDIEIIISKRFEKEKCKGLLKDFINLQGLTNQNFIDKWIGTYQDSVEQKSTTFLKKALSNTIKLKAYKNIEDLTKGLLTENWFSISYQISYQNDTFEKMSDGKKAFVVLKLLLEFNEKKCPILIDQPEDSLDNRAIYNELVTYIKEKKKSRQIILVTHNANIVVNADAEEIIVANQHGEDSKNQKEIKFQYVSGGLENTKFKDKKINSVLHSQGIKEHVCEILEGGSEAFKKRETKYGIR